MLKSFKLSLCLLFVLSTIVFAGCSKNKEVEASTGKEEVNKVQIGMTQLVEHPSLDLISKGIKDALSEKGYNDGENIEIDFVNAQGDMKNTQIIAQSFKQKDLIIAITTPSAQAAYNTIKDKPIVFSGVTDPESAGLIADNITGVSDMTPIKKQLELLKKLLPGAKKVGMIYNSSEMNSEVQVKITKQLVEELDLELVIIPVTESTEIPLALDKVLSDVDALYTHVDNTVAAAYPLIVKKADEKGVPIIGAVDDYVKKEALATEGINNYNVGIQTGEMVARVLSGQDISEIPYETLEETELIINKKVAEKYDIIIPDELKEIAQFVE